MAKKTSHSQEKTATRQSTTKERLKKYIQIAGRFMLRSSLPEILLVVSLLIARYLPNSDFSYPTEIILPIVLLGALATAFFYLFKKILKSTLAAHAAALPITYGLYAYSYAYPALRQLVDMLTPNTLTTPFTTMVVTVLVWFLVFGSAGFLLDRILHLKRFSWLQNMPLLKITVFAICFIFVMQIGAFGQRLWTIRHQLAYSYIAPDLPRKDSSLTQDTAGSVQPNIYYLVFDRYASNETLSRQYGFDNSAMTRFLDERGFVTRQNAYANYPFTIQSISSTLTMDYHLELGSRFRDDATPLQTAFPYRDILNHPPVAEQLQKNGYVYNQVSSWWDFTRDNPTADSEPSKSFRLRIFDIPFWLSDLQRDIVNKSILSPLALKGLTTGSSAVLKYDHDNNPRQNFEEQIAAVKGIASAAQADAKKPQFTFAHILSPHDPYVFSETGEIPTYGPDRTDDGADENIKYVNQLRYINTQLQDLVSTILEKDPFPVIVIQSDEGPYPKQFRGTLSPTHYYDPVTLPAAEAQQKFGILASYYMPGINSETVREQIDSSVNAFRFVLNQYLGYELEKLPDCHFTAGNKYYIYQYELANQKLTGLENPESCKQYE